MKKIFISILSSLMIVSCLGCNIFAEEPETLQDPESIVQEEIEPIVQEEPEPLLLAEPPVELKDADPMEIPEEYATKVSNIVINFAWAFSGGGKFLFGACLSGGIVGILDVASDLLGEVIYFGPSQEELDRQEMMDKLNSIDASIGDVSSKVDSLAEQINASIKQIDTKLDDISIKLDKDNITEVAKIANYLRNEMDNYDSVLTSQVHTWYDNKNLDNYLTVDSFILKVPNGGTKTVTCGSKSGTVDDLDIISIPADLMSSTINAYIKEQLDTKHNDGWDADRKDDIVKEIFKRIINSADFDKETDSQFDKWIKKLYNGYTDWDSFVNKEEALNTIANAGYSSLCEIAAKNIAKNTNGSDTYVKGLLDKFSTYCNYLTETNNEYTSPLKSYANIYSSIYAFQGDLKRTIEIDEYDSDGNPTGNKIEENTNLLKLSMEKYIGELNQLGSFVGIMAKASGNYGEETDMRKLVYIPWAAAEKKLEDDYAKYYHVINGNEIDNYCYITNSVLDYFDGSVSCDLVMKFYAWENGFGTDIKSYRDTYMATDWTFDRDNNLMVDSTNLSLVFAHYANTNGNLSFVDYLNKNSIEVNDKLPSEIVTRFIGGRDFTSDDKVVMFVKNCHNNPDKWEGKDYLKGDTTTVTSSSKYFKVRRKATADTFNLNTGVATLGKRIAAVASFYEKYTFKDDLVVFWDAEYNNPQNIDELKALAKKDEGNHVYWRERYDTKSDDEERYRSHVEYVRNYGTILSLPLNSLSDPGRNKVNSYSSTVATNILDDTSSEIEALNNRFIEKLKEKGSSKPEYNNYDYEDTYRVYLDETQYDGIIDEATYNKLLTYLSNDTNLNKMADDYFTYNDLINKMLDNLDDEYIIKDKAEKLIESLIEDDLDCIIVDEVPKNDLGKNVYNNTDGQFYVWNETKYVPYDETIKNKTPNDDTEHEGVNDDPSDYSLKFDAALGDYPSELSTDFKLKYHIKTILAYELTIDDGGSVSYEIYPIYDVNPILTWKDKGVDKQAFVSEKALELMNVGRVELLLPIIKLNDKKDNRASINHYHDLEQMESPFEKFSATIIKINDYKYAKFSVKSFSPFVITKTYFEDYKIPTTGVN